MLSETQHVMGCAQHAHLAGTLQRCLAIDGTLHCRRLHKPNNMKNDTQQTARNCLYRKPSVTQNIALTHAHAANNTENVQPGTTIARMPDAKRMIPHCEQNNDDVT